VGDAAGLCLDLGPVAEVTLWEHGAAVLKDMAVMVARMRHKILKPAQGPGPNLGAVLAIGGRCW
jgi:hypothetical protein